MMFIAVQNTSYDRSKGFIEIPFPMGFQKSLSAKSVDLAIINYLSTGDAAAETTLRLATKP